MSKQFSHYAAQKDKQMESITERVRGMERGARSVNNHLNKLENSSRTEDVNTHIEKVHCMSNKTKF